MQQSTEFEPWDTERSLTSGIVDSGSLATRKRKQEAEERRKTEDEKSKGKEG